MGLCKITGLCKKYTPRPLSKNLQHTILNIYFAFPNGDLGILFFFLDNEGKSPSEILGLHNDGKSPTERILEFFFTTLVGQEIYSLSFSASKSCHNGRDDKVESCNTQSKLKTSFLGDKHTSLDKQSYIHLVSLL